MRGLETIGENRSFDGVQGVYTHRSDATGCDMRFSVFVPPQAQTEPVPVLWWLSGLTCTEENFTVKAGAQRHAAEHGLIVVAPDTSPRGRDRKDRKVPDSAAYDLGQGAGFYVNATRNPWSTHYHMYDYITAELPDVVFDNFPGRRDAQGIFGHSMGGHGAITIALTNPGVFASVSAFSPICAPMRCPWGEKAFTAYLGKDRESWRDYDATELVSSGHTVEPAILIEQGAEDPFLAEQLYPEVFIRACRKAGQPVELRMREGYDHSYYFIATFMADHIAHHATALNAV